MHVVSEAAQVPEMQVKQMERELCLCHEIARTRVYLCSGIVELCKVT